VQACVRTWRTRSSACVAATRRALAVNCGTSVTLLLVSTALAVPTASRDPSVTARLDTQVNH